jgi:hypothetical protein
LEDPAAVHVQRSQQGRGAMADVLVLLAGRAAGGNRLGRPGAAAGTDSGLLIHRQHQRVGRRQQVQPADISRALPEGGVIGAGDPAAHPVGLDVEVGEDPADLGGGDADVGQRVASWRWLQWLAGSGGSWVTVATIRSRWSWP